MLETLDPTLTELQAFLAQGGPAIWVITALSVATLALILWKLWRLMMLGAWAGRTARASVELWCRGDQEKALRCASEGRGMRSRVVLAALQTRMDTVLSEAHAREETARVAQQELARARAGLRARELSATIAPLIGLLGTVLGMIAAFQALQEAGARADPAVLAGGIWEALLTTAAGMAVAIPASVALTWFEAVIDRIRRDIEDNAARIFLSPAPAKLQMAAE